MFFIFRHGYVILLPTPSIEMLYSLNCVYESVTTKPSPLSVRKFWDVLGYYVTPCSVLQFWEFKQVQMFDNSIDL